jgi:hypothetical protein
MVGPHILTGLHVSFCLEQCRLTPPSAPEAVNPIMESYCPLCPFVHARQNQLVRHVEQSNAPELVLSRLRQQHQCPLFHCLGYFAGQKDTFAKACQLLKACGL